MRRTSLIIPAMLLAISAALLSCGKPAPPPPGGQNAVDSKTADSTKLVTEPIKWQIGKQGGRFVVASIAPPKTFNYVVANETSSTAVLGHIYRSLTDTDPVTTEVKPDLAESWDVSEDGLTYTFHLRKDVKWNDGQPFTAADVEFTMNEVIYNENISNPSRDIYTVEGEPFKVKALDDHTVEFRLPKKFAPFLRMAPVVLPKHSLKPLVDSGKFEYSLSVSAKPEEIVGTGPFMLEKYVTGERVILKRNPFYWKKDEAGNQLPYFDQIVIEIVQTQDVEVMKFLQKELDEISVRGEDYPNVKLKEKEGDYTVYITGTAMGSFFLFFNQNNDRDVPLSALQAECESLGIDASVKEGEDEQDHKLRLRKALPKEKLDELKAKKGKPYLDPMKVKWFRNVSFRKAVAHAIDREAMIKGLMNGLGEPQWSPESPANVAFYNPNVPKYPYDPEKARKILAEAGFKDRNGDGIVEDEDGNKVEFNLTTNAGNLVRERQAQMIRKDLEGLGFKVNYLPLEFNMLVSKLDASFDWEAMILGLTGDIEPHGGKNVWHSTGYTHMWYPRQVQPSTDWEARIDELFEKGVQELDPAKRKAIYDEWQMIAADKLPLIYTVLPKRIAAVRNGIGNIHPTAYAGAVHTIERLYWK